MNEELVMGFGAYYLIACDTATPPHVLAWLVKNEDARVANEALQNPNCPFRLQFLNHINTEYIEGLDYIKGDKISQSRVAVARRAEYETMLAQYGLTVEEADSMPSEWLVKLISD